MPNPHDELADKELKPCPYGCASEDYAGPCLSPLYRRPNWTVCCDTCGCEGPIKNSEAEAVAAWNSRPQDELIAELVAALEPFARLEVPKRPSGNAGFYSIFHKHILTAAQVFAKAKQEAQ